MIPFAPTTIPAAAPTTEPTNSVTANKPLELENEDASGCSFMVLTAAEATPKLIANPTIAPTTALTSLMFARAFSSVPVTTSISR
jgi:hypothetical protein